MNSSASDNMLIRIKIQYDKSNTNKKYHWIITFSYLENIEVKFWK